MTTSILHQCSGGFLRRPGIRTVCLSLQTKGCSVTSVDWTWRPARSPDLNPLDFWLWECLNTLVYSEPIGDLEISLRRV
jgi:hypothetical protein